MIEIKRLEPQLADDFLNFFDSRAFSDNSDWSGCYCLFNRIPDDDEWDKRSPGMNRDTADTAIRSGKMSGYLAFFEGKAIGWCNGDNLDQMPRLKKFFNGVTIDLTKAFAFSCFLVERSFRQQGIATALLDFALADAKNRGFRVAVARPAAGPRLAGADPNVPSGWEQRNYHGPLALYQKAGFCEAGKSGDFILMTKILTH